MVSSSDSIIVNLKNSIVTKINTLIGNHNESNDAHEDIRESIPTKVSDLTNDSGFLTEHQSLANYLQKSNTVGLVKNNGTIDTNTYLTAHQDISGKANVSDLGDVAFSNDYTDLDNIPSTFPPSSHTHGNIGNDGKVTTVKTIDSNANVGADYFIIRDNNDSNSTKSANVLDVLNKIVLDLIDEGAS